MRVTDFATGTGRGDDRVDYRFDHRVPAPAIRVGDGLLAFTGDRDNSVSFNVRTLLSLDFAPTASEFLQFDGGPGNDRWRTIFPSGGPIAISGFENI